MDAMTIIRAEAIAAAKVKNAATKAARREQRERPVGIYETARRQRAAARTH